MIKFQERKQLFIIASSVRPLADHFNLHQIIIFNHWDDANI